MPDLKALTREKTKPIWREPGRGSSHLEWQLQLRPLFAIITETLRSVHMPLEAHIPSVLHQEKETETYIGIGHAQVVVATTTDTTKYTLTIPQTASGDLSLVTSGRVKAAC